MADIVCVHRWGEWAYYSRYNEKTQGQWRSCKRCEVIQYNDDPEPETVIAKIKE